MKTRHTWSSISILDTGGVGQQVSRMTQVLCQISCMLSDVIYLYINAVSLLSNLQDDITWVELLRPFTAVDTLHVSPVLIESVEPALKAATEAMGLLRLRIEVTKFLAVRWDCGRVIGELTRKDTIPNIHETTIHVKKRSSSHMCNNTYMRTNLTSDSS
ncbi:hypothetical protein EDB92DRAFT_1328751 [Lactarius akahatsu]|uniref:Uncharacterized protein n=1 Tax=Lactarius akahatsu TaxID=416441 RepID=A0AAD4QGS4_9AGAM|nr:hypothetical protein EDB92DRAFT_1328751 [Lactarius akahatsu]